MSDSTSVARETSRLKSRISMCCPFGVQTRQDGAQASIGARLGGNKVNLAAAIVAMGEREWPGTSTAVVAGQEPMDYHEPKIIRLEHAAKTAARSCCASSRELAAFIHERRITHAHTNNHVRLVSCICFRSR